MGLFNRTKEPLFAGGLFTQEELLAQVAEGAVTVNTNEAENLFIYNYSNKTNFRGRWNKVTKNTRGLILDKDGLIIARSFPKFFDLARTNLLETATTRPVVHEKLDGVLGIIYPHNDKFNIATRGSMTSGKANVATSFLRTRMPDFSQPEGFTTLVEIISPGNRIIVDYGNEEKLVLLGAVENATGRDIPPEDVDWWDGPKADRHDITLEEAAEILDQESGGNREGYVCTWYNDKEPATRVKVKYRDYVRLHGIVFGFSERKVWELLRLGINPIEEIGKNAPTDEFYELICRTTWELQAQYEMIAMQAYLDFETAAQIKGSRRKIAASVKQMQYPDLVFALLDGTNIEQKIWKLVKP